MDIIASAVQQFIDLAHQAIKERGQFTVALSGGSTPKAIYQTLSQKPKALDWGRVFLFWSDERSVPPDHPDSNYRMAMEHLGKLPILEEHIFRMHAENDIEVNAAAYEHVIKAKTDGIFDLVMLGMGEDGHTASLFPGTEALKITDRLVVPNYIPHLDSWRMTLTFPCINAARTICVYVLGEKKRARLKEVLAGENDFPISYVKNPHWVTDIKL